MIPMSEIEVYRRSFSKTVTYGTMIPCLVRKIRSVNANKRS